LWLALVVRAAAAAVVAVAAAVAAVAVAVVAGELEVKSESSGTRTRGDMQANRHIKGEAACRQADTQHKNSVRTGPAAQAEC
jgi:hypothetical protein